MRAGVLLFALGLGDKAMRYIKGIVSAALMGLLAPNAFAPDAFAGAWTQEKGKGLIISGSSINRADLAFDSESKLRTPVDFEKLDSTFYLEYGVSDKLTLVGNTALQDVSYTSSEGPQLYSGFATSKLGLRYGFDSGSPWVFAVQPSLVIPAGGEAVPDGDLGIGGFGAEIRLLAGRALTVGNRPGFFNAEAAFDQRSDGAPRQITADMTLGIQWAKHVQIIGQGFYRHTNDARFEGDAILANESLKLQASVVVDLPKLRRKKKKAGDDEAQEIPVNPARTTSLQIGVFQTVAGRNIVREQGVMMTLWNKF